MNHQRMKASQNLGEGKKVPFIVDNSLNFLITLGNLDKCLVVNGREAVRN